MEEEKVIREDILDELLTATAGVDAIFNTLATDRYGAYHIMSILLRGIRGHLTMNWITKDLQVMDREALNKVQLTKVPAIETYSMAKAINKATGEEVDFSVEVLDLNGFDIDRFILNEEYAEYVRKSESLGVSLADAIGPDMMMVRITFDHNIIYTLYDHVNSRVVILFDKPGEEGKLLKLSEDKELNSFANIISTLMHFYIFITGENTKYTLDDEETVAAVDRLVSNCDDDDVKSTFGRLIVESMEDKDTAVMYTQNIIRLQGRAVMGNDIPNPADKDKLN